jgi:hypothetical protein
MEVSRVSRFFTGSGVLYGVPRVNRGINHIDFELDDSLTAVCKIHCVWYMVVTGSKHASTIITNLIFRTFTQALKLSTASKIIYLSGAFSSVLTYTCRVVSI